MIKQINDIYFFFMIFMANVTRRRKRFVIMYSFIKMHGQDITTNLVQLSVCVMCSWYNNLNI